MATRPVEELYYDSETMLRLVDGVLDELRGGHPSYEAAPELAMVPEALHQVRNEVRSALEKLRDGRSTLDEGAVRAIRGASEDLCDICSTTELATTRVLDGIDRAHAIVDQFEKGEGTDRDRARLAAELRIELFAVVDCMQLQDVIAQRLDAATMMLRDLESRFGKLIPLPADDEPDGGAPVIPLIRDAAQRQKIVDEIVAGR